MLHLGQWIIDVEWKKGPRPSGRGPDIAGQIRSLFLAGRSYKNPSIGLAKTLGLVGNKRQEHVPQGNCFNPPRGPEYAGAEFPKVSHLHSISHSERAGAF
jgi:hypothetical protein